MFPALDLQACASSGWELAPSMVVRMAIASGLLGLAGWSGARRRFPGQQAFVGMCLVMALWLSFSVLGVAAAKLACRSTLGLLAWGCSMTVPMLLALFLHQYTQSEFRLPRWGMLLLFSLPSLFGCLLAATNGWHGLVYGPQTRLSPAPDGIARTLFHYRGGFYLLAAISYSWLLVGVVLLLRALRTASAQQRRQWGVFLLITSVPVMANIAYLVGGWRLWGADPTTTAFAAAVLGFAWLIRRVGVFNVVPVAHRLLFDELPSPVFVLNAEQRVAEANQAALRLHPDPASAGDAMPLAEWPRVGAALARHLRSARSDALLELNDPPAWYEVQHRSIGSPRGAPIGAMIVLHDVTELREQARCDALTGAANRRALEERYALETARGRRCTLVLMDLDHFKSVNDTHGHLVGDAVLRDFTTVLSEFISALRSGLRAGDPVYRIGGEEFVLLFQGAAIEETFARMSALHRLVRSQKLGGLPGALTFSSGLAFTPDSREPLQSLLARADAALYAAKHKGRDRCELAPAQAEQPALTR